MQFPDTRLRRNRSSAWIRDLVAENNLHASDLILPLFITDGDNLKTKIESMDGIFRYSIDLLVEEVKLARDLGIKAIALFPATPAHLKNLDGSESFNPDNLISKATRAIKAQVQDIGIICDVALDPYTSHGHDGIIVGDQIDNDVTIEVLIKQALNQAQAGADIIAPSDMMDGRIGKIRQALDINGFKHVLILAYSAKYASAFYGPFRDAVCSNTNFANKSKESYQMDYRNKNEAILEIAMDVNEGADIIMVKPALPYLDIIADARTNFKHPIFAYQVSGEYAMIKSAGLAGIIDYKKTMLESLTSIKRAGSNAILTYAAIEVAKWLK